MLKIGLTGGIGSGKSTVAHIFRVLGIPVFDADDEAKKLMQTDTHLKQNIIETFGAASYDEGGLLNRKHLAAAVFSDAFLLDKLNAIVHPATIAAATSWFSRQSGPYAIKEAALLFEAGTSTGLDYIIGVQAPLNLRILRAMKRDGVERAEVLKRMNRQIDEAIKMLLCDFVLVNDEQQLLTPQVVALHEKLMALNKSA